MEGIEFWSVIVIVVKLAIDTTDKGYIVIYRGSFVQIQDDNGNCYSRGVRVFVSETCFNMLRNSQTRDSFIFIRLAAAFIPKTLDSHQPRQASDNKGLPQLIGGRKKGSCC